MELRAEQRSAERTSQCRSTIVRGGRAERRAGLCRAPNGAARESAKQASREANSRPAELPVPQHESATQSSREASSLQPSHRCRSARRSAGLVSLEAGSLQPNYQCRSTSHESAKRASREASSRVRVSTGVEVGSRRRWIPCDIVSLSLTDESHFVFMLVAPVMCSCEPEV